MDIQLHYTCRGSGAPLLLLHGNGENSTFFSAQLEDFSTHFCACAIDTRGHGQSPMGSAPFTLSQFADDLAAFMDEHNLERADILGFSDGGNIALLFALRHPHRVRRLILNSANLFPEGLEPWLLDSFVEERRQLRHSDAADKDYRIALLDLMINEPHIDPANLAALTMPALVIAGDRDIVQFEHTMLIAESIPHARLAIIPGGHDVAAVHPEAFNRAVFAFLEETEEETP
jgi:pimeloyl-ACP methyl ester carboxylesterase